MQITRQADYALRAMLYLAEKYPAQKKVPTSEIAKHMRIPPSFLAKIISQLNIVGLIQTSRGAQGGVYMARQPENICVLEVVEAIDGPISLNECSAQPDGCPFGEDCPIRPIWCSTQHDLVDKLRLTSFQQLLQARAAKKN